MKPKLTQSRSLLFVGLLALLAIFCGFTGFAGFFDIPFAKPDGMDARDWVSLWMILLWICFCGGASVLVGICCILFVRALDGIKRTFPDAKVRSED